MIVRNSFTKILGIKSFIESHTRHINYIQGQSDGQNKKVREYFYYIDHHGQLFLDDTKIKNFTSCFKEQKFLQFFYKNIRLNGTNRYQDTFPFVSYCGIERNYIHCDDLPFVFTELDRDEDILNLNNVKILYCSFKPELLHVSIDTGRIYYPFIENIEKLPTSIGLMKSNLCLELLKSIEIKSENEVYFNYKSKIYRLNNNEEFSKKMDSLIKRFSSCKDYD